MAWILWDTGTTIDRDVDVRSPDGGGVRWFRRLDHTDGRYRYSQDSTWNRSTDRLPSGLDEEAPTVHVTDSDGALRCFAALSALAVDLAGTLVAIAVDAPAVAEWARRRARATEAAVDSANESRNEAQRARNDIDRTRLVRLGVRQLTDAHSHTLDEVRHRSGQVGRHLEVLLAIAGRGRSIGTSLYSALR
ncbi:hypothetical protein [Actinosynnema sp. NPDC020468]|uniref:hypothetical protein n=1 Tax=Actinosynnema sp. NPDC020468 TaxID=3154488 RepID=UPI0033DE2AC8